MVLGLVVFLLWRSSFCELWTGERLDLEKAIPCYRGVGRSISVSLFLLVQALIFWRSCRYIGALFRALVALSGGVRWFIPCDVGANHCRLRHIGWERCGHGLTSRPRESASEGFLNELLVLFGCPCGSAAALLSGVPLGVFLLMVMFRDFLLFLLVMWWPRNGQVGRSQLPGLGFQSRTKVWKRLRAVEDRWCQGSAVASG